MQRNLFLTVIRSFLLFQADAQNGDKLNQLKNVPVRTYYSNGRHEQRAAGMATRIGKAIRYHQHLTGFEPEVTLLVLDTADWKLYAANPVYGMPHYKGVDSLVVAAEDNPFWKGFLPPLNQLPEPLSKQVQAVYRVEDGTVSMRPFFDLLAIHELGHAFHFQGGLNIQRLWMGELFCNILLHTYIAENEPEQLPALTLFPKMIVGAGAKEYTYTRLNDVEELYEEMGSKHPKNYGWFQCRWHSAAAGIYDTGGKELFTRLWKALKEQKERLPDALLVDFLETKVSRSVADVMRNWDKETVQ